MSEPAIYTMERKGAHAIYAIGVGNKSSDEIVVELATKDIFPYGRVDRSVVPTLVFGHDTPGQRYLGIIILDLRTLATPEIARVVFNIHGEPQLELLQGITNIAIAASNQETRDSIFGKIVEATNFFPEYRYGGAERYIGAKLDKLLEAHKGNWQQFLAREDLSRFYTEGLREVRQKEALRRVLAQSGIEGTMIEEAIRASLKPI